jgi:hypothetical protein
MNESLKPALIIFRLVDSPANRQLRGLRISFQYLNLELGIVGVIRAGKQGIPKS